MTATEADGANTNNECSSSSNNTDRTESRSAQNQTATNNVAKLVDNDAICTSASSQIQMFSNQLTAALNSISLTNDDDQTTTISSASAETRKNNNFHNSVGNNDAEEDEVDASINNNSKRRPSEGSLIYAPQPTSRRNSKAGDQLIQSMKATAAEVLAELDNMSDDDDDDDVLIMN
jgi:hypothetical protein